MEKNVNKATNEAVELKTWIGATVNRLIQSINQSINPIQFHQSINPFNQSIELRGKHLGHFRDDKISEFSFQFGTSLWHIRERNIHKTRFEEQPVQLVSHHQVFWHRLVKKSSFRINKRIRMRRKAHVRCVCLFGCTRSCGFAIRN